MNLFKLNILLLSFFCILADCKTTTSKNRIFNVIFSKNATFLGELEFRSDGKFQSYISQFDTKEKKFKSLLNVPYRVNKVLKLSDYSYVTAGECHITIVLLKNKSNARQLTLCDQRTIEAIRKIHFINPDLFLVELSFLKDEKLLNKIYLVDLDGNIIGEKMLRKSLNAIDSNFETIGISDLSYTLVDFRFNTIYAFSENSLKNNFYINLFKDLIIIQNVNDSFVKLYERKDKSNPEFIRNIEIPHFSETDFFAINQRVGNKLFIADDSGNFCWLNLEESNIEKFRCDKLSISEPGLLGEIPGGSNNEFYVLDYGKSNQSLIYLKFKITEKNQIKEEMKPLEIQMTPTE